MSTAIGYWPIHQNRPGGRPETSDCLWLFRAEPFEQSNRYWTVSPETVLEDCPSSLIASVKRDAAR